VTPDPEHERAQREAATLQALEAFSYIRQARRQALRSLVWGLAIALIGGAISLATYLDASDQAATAGGSHSYYVLWGAVAFGLLKTFRAARVLLLLRKML
jgi:hypothetical protein